uniref:Uncharacterized protein n=1 Tax=Anguilla anguilla TaxID=7936 RepID=A0A0E9PYB3_ANGAN
MRVATPTRSTACLAVKEEEISDTSHARPCYNLCELKMRESEVLGKKIMNCKKINKEKNSLTCLLSRFY